MEEALVREVMLEGLIGVGSSRRTYYSEYREQERRLERAIASIANISDALCNTTSGVPALAQAIVRVAAQHFEAECALLMLSQAPEQRWAARSTLQGVVAWDARAVPTLIDAAAQQVIGKQRLFIADQASAPRMLGAPMFLADTVVGALLVIPGAAIALDRREVSVLQTLANQAAVAVQNARLYEESERLRAQTTALYEEACQQKAELESKNRQLAKARRWLATARQNEVVNSERNRIARELHDSVAQYLICIGMNLEWCRTQLVEQTPVHDRICSSKELARSAITRMRTAIFELSAISSVPSSLSLALNDLVRDIEKAAQLNVCLHIGEQRRSLSADIEHALYQITQEALFNVYKHAQAQTATVELRFRPNVVQLVVSDDGIGIGDEQLYAPTTSALGQHCGLRNMRARAQELDGRCTIRQGRRGGTRVCVTIPTNR
jgi:signal transduction histidine kinase